jgi:hypothetical protein
MEIVVDVGSGISFYSAIWLIGFTTAFVRVLRDDDYKSLVHCLSVASASGFFCFAVVSIANGDNPGDASRSWYWLGVAALMGLAVKEQDAVARSILSKVLKVFSDDSTGTKT